ncbi:glycerol-3-phosphate dehydrogenase subunit GlpB [Desulfomarina sp.]
MAERTRHISTDLAIIGSGLAGFSASIFALNRNIKTTQVGDSGAVTYTTGYLDLLGCHFPDSMQILDDPWLGVQQLREIQPNHPLSQLTEDEIRSAFMQVTDFLSSCGIRYSRPGVTNLQALTPVGTLKPTLCLPETMLPGVEAFRSEKPTVIVDFKGLKGFSGRQIVANLKTRWPNLATCRIEFPDARPGELYPEPMARSLEVPGNREKLAVLLKKTAGSREYIGLPAILGIHKPDRVREELERLTGKKIFEIPTMPPGVPGIRLREMFQRVFPEKGLSLIPQQKVQKISLQENTAKLELTDNLGPVDIKAKCVLLATGRFLSGGLQAGFHGLKESLLNLPVTQPASRSEWYRRKYTDRNGHPVNQAGIEVDSSFRPLDSQKKVYSRNLFAAGSLLAHQDWIRARCGAGIALGTAYKAVEEAERQLRKMI